ncbi:ComF family protein [Clostridioides difficile]
MKICNDDFIKSFKNLINKCLDFIYPENINCIICDKSIKKTNTYSVCKSCFNEMNFILDGCIKCGKPIIHHSLEKEFIEGCSYCFNKSFYFDKSISCIEYNDITKKIILGLKYNQKTFMAKYIAQIMKEKLDLENVKFDYVLFVPLHRKRLNKRGFNQAQKIALSLSKIISVPILDCISREKHTRMLYKLSKQERKKELKNVFAVNENIKLINNKNVLLIDDIFTTGLTTNEISKILKLSGVNKVFVMTLLTRANDNYVME